MNKMAIGILDYKFEALGIFEHISKKYVYESFIYINEDFDLSEDEKEIEKFNKRIEKKIGILISKGIKMLLVTNDVIVEYSENILNNLNIPVINVVKAIIDFVNTNYEQKDLILLAKLDILKANLYQKNFKYNHLYNISSDEMKLLLKNNLIKTSKSFAVCRETFKQVLYREINLLIITENNLEKLKTEIKECVKFDEIIDLKKVFANEIMKYESLLANKNRRHIFIISELSKKDLKKITFNYKIRYRYLSYKNLMEENTIKEVEVDSNDNEQKSNN